MRKKDAEKRIKGHRKAIEEHIEKSEKYDLDYQKEEALRTVERAQKEIEKLKGRSGAKIDDSPLDNWKPGKKAIFELLYLVEIRKELLNNNLEVLDINKDNGLELNK